MVRSRKSSENYSPKSDDATGSPALLGGAREALDKATETATTRARSCLPLGLLVDSKEAIHSGSLRWLVGGRGPVGQITLATPHMHCAQR